MRVANRVSLEPQSSLNVNRGQRSANTLTCFASGFITLSCVGSQTCASSRAAILGHSTDLYFARNRDRARCTRCLLRFGPTSVAWGLALRAMDSHVSRLG
jgi:hypothetical protein